MFNIIHMNNYTILAIIPARSGSKGLPGKNIINYKGKPMLAWSIQHAQDCKYQIRTIVSTDSKEYADIANKYNAETPFLRPPEISGDYASDFECIKHCIDYLRINEGYSPDIILHLRPTQPERKVTDINNCLDLFIENFEKYDSLRSVIPIEKSPYKMYTVSDNNLHPLFKKYADLNEPFNQARQLLPQCYLHNGYIDIIKTSILVNNTISGNNILPYIMNPYDNVDIDHLKDL